MAEFGFAQLASRRPFIKRRAAAIVENLERRLCPSATIPQAGRTAPGVAAPQPAQVVPLNVFHARTVGPSVRASPAVTRTATDLQLTAQTTPETAFTAFSLNVLAVDADGLPVTTYTGTIHFVSDDPHAVLPANYTFTLANHGSHTFSVTLTVAGSPTITATDTANDTLSGSVQVPVNAAATSLSLSSSANPLNDGDPITFTATVSGPGGNINGNVGNVNFDDSSHLGPGELLHSVPLSNSGAQVTLPTVFQMTWPPFLGTRQITASYSGGGGWLASQTTFNETVLPSRPALSSDANSVDLGHPVTLSTSIFLMPGSVDQGSVNFLDGSTVLGSVPFNIDGSGSATFTTSALSLGTHNITAVHVFQGLTSNPSPVVSVQVRPGTTTSLSSSPNPSAHGQAVTFTATVTGSGPTTPTGVVQFLNGAGLSYGQAALDATGKASLTISTLPVGSTSLHAHYPGDGTFNGSNSNSVTQQVGPSTVALTAGPEMSLVGQAVTIRATVTGVGAGTPGGTVSFSEGQLILVPVGTASLVGGTASLTTASLPVGVDELTAAYSGDAEFAPSSQSVFAQVFAHSLASSGKTITSVEGAPFAGTVATFTDSPLATPADYTVTINWGDGTSSPGTVTTTGSGAFNVAGSHTYAEEGNSPVNVTIQTTGSQSTATGAAMVADAALTATGRSAGAQPGATFFDTVASFTDADPAGVVADYSAMISWGDGTNSVATIAGNTSGGWDVIGRHVYSTAQVYPTSVTISDAGGAPATATGSINVSVGPVVLAAAFQYDHLPQSVSIQFDRDVHASLLAADLSVQNLTTGAMVTPVNMSYDMSTNTATFYFQGALPDGNYRATLPASAVSDPAGNHMAAAYTLDFFVLSGDINHDRHTNFQDLLILAQHYGGPGTFVDGDLNYDGRIDFNDLLILAQSYGKTLAPP